MANPYTAVFRDDNSDTRLAGSVDFTDSANQPGAGMSVASVQLTNAEILTLPSLPVELVPAPGAGRWIAWSAAYVSLDVTHGAYVADANSSLNLLWGPSIEASGVLETFGGLTDAGSYHTFYYVFPQLFGAGAGDFAGTFVMSGRGGIDNLPLLVADEYDGVADYTGGNAANTMRVTVFYTILQT